MDKYQELFIINKHEADSNGYLTINRLCSMYLEVVGKQARKYGFHIDDLNVNNQTWMLGRLQIKIIKLPKINDKIKLQTWPSGIYKLYAMRDFQLMDEKDSDLILASSAWLAVDLNLRRPLRVGKIINDSLILPKYVEHDFSKIPLLNEITYSKIFSVKDTDIDLNQHVNYISYINWIFQTLPEELIKSNQLDYINIHFKQEALAGDSIISLTERIENKKNSISFIHSIADKDKKVEFAQAATMWKAIKENSI